MNEITSKNLQDFCRACLKCLKQEGNCDDISKSLDSYPNLKNFFNNIIADQQTTTTTMYPKSFCTLCFKNLENLLSDYQKFQNLIIHSTQRIQTILKSEEKRSFGNPSDDDNQLLLPELAQWNMTNIKAEPLENVPETGDYSKEIKTEIDFELDNGSSSCDPNVMIETLVNSDDQLNQTYTDESKKRDRRKKSFKCPNCDKHAYKKVYLDAHIRKIHEGLDKPFLCSVSECQKAFTRYNQLHVHIQTNHSIDAIKFTCDIEGCNESFRLGQTLESHRRVVHKFKKMPPLEFSPVNQEQLKHKRKVAANICQECGKKFHAKKALSEHLRRHANDKRYVCNVCNVSKVTKTELITHKRIHDKNLEKFKCTLCPQEFNHKNAISRHVRVVHEGERRFGCRFCTRRFGTKNSQVCHERLHSGSKPYQCEICLRRFTQVEGLKSHMKNHDKNLRKHVCKFCSARFITKKNLLDHEQRHFSNKPHICRICSRGFPRSEELTLHLKDQHEIDDDAANDDDSKHELSLEFSGENVQTNIDNQDDVLENSNDVSMDNFESADNDPLSA